MNKFDQVVAGALDIAQSKAIENKNTELAPAHLLYGLIANPSSFTSKAYKADLAKVEALLEHIPKTTSDLNPENIRPSGALSGWLTQASGNAAKSGRQEMGERDLLKFLP
ncbi:MAG: ATP-dependent chaperone ClpB, partial [Bacteriovoracaceae bacterium]|nr:ATP-dependent chaperone ClpB [Bacteriovoracaceae bacterium]